MYSTGGDPSVGVLLPLEIEETTLPLSNVVSAVLSATARAAVFAALLGVVLATASSAAEIGAERSAYERTEDGEEYRLNVQQLIDRGRKAFIANWTPVEGGGRPFSTGTGSPLADPSSPLEFPRNFNRISAMDANSCFGCHNAPGGAAGGGGDFVTGVFVAAQRLDFATFDHSDLTIGRGAIDESGAFATAQTIGNYRATLGMYGAGFIEMLARQMTAELQSIRDATLPGERRALDAGPVSFGQIARTAAGDWMVDDIEGLPPVSTASAGPNDPPSLVIQPFHQSGSVVSIRQFTVNAFNHHHGMQSVERVGRGTDPDGDGVVDELTRGDITAVSLFQATLPVPTQTIPGDPARRRAIATGQQLFSDIGCAHCHVPSLPLVDGGWVYVEPNPYNPPGTLQRGEAAPLSIDLTDERLPGKRPKPVRGVVEVRAYTDLKLHDITTGPGDPGEEAIDINQPGGSTAFFAGNRRFLTKKLWGAASEPPYFHHGKFTTLRQATLAHDGEARTSRLAFEALSVEDRDRIIEFLKSLTVELPRGGAGGR